MKNLFGAFSLVLVGELTSELSLELFSGRDQGFMVLKTSFMPLSLRRSKRFKDNVQVPTLYDGPLLRTAGPSRLCLRGVCRGKELVFGNNWHDDDGWSRRSRRIYHLDLFLLVRQTFKLRGSVFGVAVS